MHITNTKRAAAESVRHRDPPRTEPQSADACAETRCANPPEGDSAVTPDQHVAAAEEKADTVRNGAATVPVHRNRNAISALVGIVGFFSVWGLTAALESDGRVLAVFLDVPSAVLVVLTPVTILFAVYGWAGVLDAFAWVFRRPTPGKPARDAVVFFELAAAFALAGGFLATMVGMILMLANMDDVSMIGSGMALTLLSQLYGVFLAVVCIALAAYLARRHNDPADDSTPVGRRAAGIAGITTIAGTLTVMVAFGIMMLSLAPNL